MDLHPSLSTSLVELSIEPVEGGFIDLTLYPNEVTMRLCYRLVQSGRVILHGSNSSMPYARLEPKSANDALKASGNQTAVFATDNVGVALMQAVLDRDFIQSLFASFVIGYRIVEGIPLLKVTDNIYQLFVQEDRRLCSDGYVYVLDNARFNSISASAAEYVSLSPVDPWYVLKVSAELRLWLLSVGNPRRPDTVFPYSTEEQSRLALHTSRLLHD